ncbi:surface lipoprotein assembly modifier [Sulfitobacter sp.]|uniref:surface lipoprotein assembly modifier n=1 Tax=Sulfitobacter sp. TaxID=1903071 RepID=UPI0030021F12
MTAAPVALAQQAPETAVHLSVEQMRRAAELNLRNEQYGRALAFADALLERDPQDVTALLIRAHALRARAKYGEAQQAARDAWRLAKTYNQKFTASMLMAQALSSDGKRTRAQFWLRRAAQVAPTTAHANRAVQDFRYVQQRNPWQTNLSFTFQPSSNINNGSANDSSTLLYEILHRILGDSEVALGASSKALSGLETGLALQSRYRFYQTERTAHDLRIGLSYRTYRLSNSAKDDLAAEDAARVARGEAPLDVSGADFAFGTVQVGYGYKQLRADRRGEFSLSADIGQSFYGGARYQRYLRAGIGQSYYLDAKNKLDFGLSTDIRRAQRGGDQEQLSLSGGISKRLAGGDGLYLGAAVSTMRSDTERLEYDEVRLRSGYLFGREVMGTSLQLGLSTSYRDYNVTPHGPDGRREFQVAAEATATFKNIDYMGFNPTVSLSASTTNSNIGLYDVNRVGLSIGIASAF